MEVNAVGVQIHMQKSTASREAEPKHHEIRINAASRSIVCGFDLSSFLKAEIQSGLRKWNSPPLIPVASLCYSSPADKILCGHYTSDADSIFSFSVSVIVFSRNTAYTCSIFSGYGSACALIRPRTPVDSFVEKGGTASLYLPLSK